jgi:hypothetical protein
VRASEYTPQSRAQRLTPASSDRLPKTARCRRDNRNLHNPFGLPVVGPSRGQDVGGGWLLHHRATPSAAEARTKLQRSLAASAATSDLKGIGRFMPGMIARALAAMRREFSPAVRQAALSRAGHGCQSCGTREQREFHHAGGRVGLQLPRPVLSMPPPGGPETAPALPKNSHRARLAGWLGSSGQPSSPTSGR